MYSTTPSSLATPDSRYASIRDYRFLFTSPAVSPSAFLNPNIYIIIFCESLSLPFYSISF